MAEVTLLTGASSGIGMELAREFARHKHNLVLVARRKEKLYDLGEELSALGVSVDLCLPRAKAHADLVLVLMTKRR